MVLSSVIGSATSFKCKLRIGDHFLGLKVCEVPGVGEEDPPIEIYAIQIAENMLYPVVVPTGTFADGVLVSGVFLPTGQTKSAYNWTGQSLSTGDKAHCYQNQVDGLYYLIAAGNGTFNQKTWPAFAAANIAAGASNTVLLPDATLGVGGLVTAENWSDDTDIFTSDKIFVWVNPVDGLYYCIKPAGTSFRAWYGTVAGDVAIAPGDSGDVQLPDTDIGVDGVVTAVNWTTYTDAVPGDKILVWQDPATDVYYFFVCGGRAIRFFLGQLNGALAASSSTANVDSFVALDGGIVPTITVAQNVFRLHAADNKPALVCQNRDGGNILLIQTFDTPEQRTWAAFATANIAATDPGNIQLPDTTLGVSGVVTATNWSPDVDVVNGDQIFAWQDPTDNNYYFICSKKPKMSRRFKGVLTGNMLSTSGTGSVGSVLALDGGATPGSATIQNESCLEGATGDFVKFEEDWSGEDLIYSVYQVQHKSHEVTEELELTDGSVVFRTRRAVYMTADTTLTETTIFEIALETFVASVSFDGTDFYQSLVQYYVFSLGDPTPVPDLVFSVSMVTVVDNVYVSGDDWYQETIELAVFSSGSIDAALIIEGTDCPEGEG